MPNVAIPTALQPSVTPAAFNQLPDPVKTQLLHEQQLQMQQLLLRFTLYYILSSLLNLIILFNCNNAVFIMRLTFDSFYCLCNTFDFIEQNSIRRSAYN